MRCVFTLALALCLLLPSAQGSQPPITRGEAVLLLWETAGAVPYDKTAHPFTDIDDDGVAQAAAWAWGEGLTHGVGNSLFAPERPITREEWAALLRRSSARLGLDVFLPEGVALCNDGRDISPWADDSLYWACVTRRLPWLKGRLAPLAPVPLEEARRSLTP